jgi:hypothetical protein
MYRCKTYGNTQYFTEMKHVATKVVLVDGQPLGYMCQDVLLSVVEVYCDVCKSSTEDGLILDENGNPVEVNQDPPDIGYSG